MPGGGRRRDSPVANSFSCPLADHCQFDILIVLVYMLAPANAGPTEDAFVVIEQFKKAYDASDPPAIVKLFAPDALFLGTTMQRPTRDKEGILKYFQASASANLRKKVEIENYEVLQLSETAVLFTGQDTFSQTRAHQATGIHHATRRHGKRVAAWRRRAGISGKQTCADMDREILTDGRRLSK